MLQRMQRWIMVDVEADGPCPGLYSMVCFGAVVVENGLERTFHSGLMSPISDDYDSRALEVSGFTRNQMEQNGKDPDVVMNDFANWLAGISDKPMFISDNNGFDWQFINYYFHCYMGSNPFGHSSTNLGSLYKGMEKSMFKNFKHLRKTKHDHNPVNDAMGNAEALLRMYEEMGLGIKF